MELKNGTTIQIRIGGENGTERTFDVSKEIDVRTQEETFWISYPFGSVEREQNVGVDPIYIANDIDDLAEQISADGHWLVGYLD